MEIRKATLKDAPALADIFLSHITAHPEYISHGEVQMGVGVCSCRNGVWQTMPAPDAREKWMRYISSHIRSRAYAQVWTAWEGKEIMGFCVADIESDGDAPFGVVCDLLVNPAARGRGLGDKLLKTAIAWLKAKKVAGIYLESGKNNHGAHRFFEKRGFSHISEIYKLA